MLNLFLKAEKSSGNFCRQGSIGAILCHTEKYWRSVVSYRVELAPQSVFEAVESDLLEYNVCSVVLEFFSFVRY